MPGKWIHFCGKHWCVCCVYVREWPWRALWCSKLSSALSHFPQQLAISVWITSKLLISLHTFAPSFLTQFSVSPNSLFSIWTFHLLLSLFFNPLLLSCLMWRCGSRKERSIALRAMGAGVGSVRLMCSGLSPGFPATPMPTTAKNWKVWNGRLWGLKCGF